MTEKTKEKLGLSAIILTSVAGLGCVGAGIWAIIGMPKPYINQWVNMADNRFDFKPIMGTCDLSYIKSWAKAQGIDDMGPDTIRLYYLDRLTMTPEIYVEDFLSHVYNSTMKGMIDQGGVFSNNTLRVSDPSIIKGENGDKNYYLSFRWDQQMSLTLNGQDVFVDWYIKFKKVPITLELKNVQDKQEWMFEGKLDDSDSWFGAVNIKKVQGFGAQTTTDGEKPIDKATYKNILTEDWFYTFDYVSTYLSECIPNKK